MSEAYYISRLAAQISDQSVIATHGFNLVKDETEECLFAWRDQQATQFAVAIDEPQREAFAPLAAALIQAESCLRELVGLADKAEFSLSQVIVQCEPCQRSAQDAVRKAETADFHASEAVGLANRSASIASSLQSEVDALGSPPISVQFA